jgi:hypothetical protein
MKAVAAAATEFLMTDPGLDEAQATGWVSRKLHEAGYSKDDGKPIMSNTVADWRDNIAASMQSDPQRQWFTLVYKQFGVPPHQRSRSRWSSDGSRPAAKAAHRGTFSRIRPIVGIDPKSDQTPV